MAIEFTVTKKQIEMREAITNLAKHVIRPNSLAWDREKGVPDEFLRNMTRLATSMGSNAMRSGVGEEDPAAREGVLRRGELRIRYGSVKAFGGWLTVARALVE